MTPNILGLATQLANAQSGFITFGNECVLRDNYEDLIWGPCRRYDGKDLAPQWMYDKNEDKSYGKIKSRLCDSAGVEIDYCWTVMGSPNGVIMLSKCRPEYPPQDFCIQENQIWSMSRTGLDRQPRYCVIHESGFQLQTARCYHDDVVFEKHIYVTPIPRAPTTTGGIIIQHYRI